MTDALRFLHDDWDIRIRGDSAELGYTSIVIVPGNWTGIWTVRAELKRVGGEWKIAGTRTHQTHETVGGQLVKLDSTYWAKKDGTVTEAKDDSAKLDALTDARRYREAFELGRKVIAGEKATGEDWFNYSKAALNLGATAEAVKGAKKAHELIPKLAPLPPWAK